MGESPDVLRRDAGYFRAPLQRPRLDRLAVLVEAAGRALDEGPVLEAGMNDLPGDRVGQRDVRSDVDPQPVVCPPRRSRTPGVDDEQLGPVPDALEQMMEEDGMGLAGVRPP
jgi:hypothetical protein